MSVLTIGALCTALISCSDDDNDTPTSTVITENTSSYTSFQQFLDFRDKQPQITAATYGGADIAFDVAIDGNENFDGSIYENVYVTYYTSDHSKIYKVSSTYSPQYQLSNKLGILNGTTTWNVGWITGGYPADVLIDVEVTIYDKETNSFYQGTLNDVTYKEQEVSVRKLNLKKL